MSQTPNQAIKNSGVNFTPTIHRDTYPFIDPVSSKAPAIPPGSSVFITGASKGIGRATAISYARAGFTHIGIGARSSLSDLTAEIIAAATNAGHPAPVVHAVTLDITSRDSVSAAAASVGAAFSGKLDVLVANAGFLEAWTRAAESDPDDWWRSYERQSLKPFCSLAASAHTP
ncbi:uncharacterized protein LTHEOB_2727 [Neofusicoccum parvum]|uniref:Putative nad-p-binding protein n=1 Tax=Botryosphaeria parva (strain UCR-NP2) TaxID=1287680 RepID=R1GAM0_BOTPV|nr:putative nad-p-binding protein [Neofusicoccum parvum UCRNP2]GME30017.1 uncharacterized protein LTHEOB_2727 [Neofusicoccum parvum]